MSGRWSGSGDGRREGRKSVLSEGKVSRTLKDSSLSVDGIGEVSISSLHSSHGGSGGVGEVKGGRGTKVGDGVGVGSSQRSLIPPTVERTSELVPQKLDVGMMMVSLLVSSSGIEDEPSTNRVEIDGSVSWDGR